jgi:hypothetical protein
VETKPIWRRREDALVFGAPLTVVPALAIVPIMVSLFVDPAFPHARAVGALLIPFLFVAEFAGLSRLGFALRQDFDVLSLFAAGTAFLFWVMTVCSGILLAIVLSQF